MAPIPILQVEGICKRFGTTQALQNASLSLCPGEVHILLGENGAGKSTLAKIIAGVYRADTGTVLIEGQPVVIRDVRAARRLGISTVFQDLSLAPQLSVADNLFLGWESSTFPFAWLARAKEQRICQPLLQQLEIEVSLEASVFRLSLAQKQMLEIAKALLQKPRILIMDEPTSTLTEREKQVLFRTLRQLQAEGVAILYVTHHLREVFEVGTRVSAMMDGSVNTTVQVTESLTENALLEMLTGRNLSIAIARPTPQNHPPLLVVENLHTKNGCIGVNLQVKPGEIVGVYGVVGCGRESLGRAIAGLLKPTQGHLTLDGQPYAPRHPKQALLKGVGYLPMDRKEAGILAQRPIRENLNLAHLEDFAKLGLLQASQERSATTAQLEHLQVRYRSMEDAIARLSGGNQQKVLFGRAIAPAPRLLVMEDPTAGIDMGTRLELYRQIKQLAEAGLSILLFSSDLLETLLLCNRVYSMYSGKIIREFTNPSLSDEEQVLADVLGQ
jgi:ribose transport system ATP-binding protein